MQITPQDRREETDRNMEMLASKFRDHLRVLDPRVAPRVEFELR